MSCRLDGCLTKLEKLAWSCLPYPANESGGDPGLKRNSRLYASSRFSPSRRGGILGRLRHELDSRYVDAVPSVSTGHPTDRLAVLEPDLGPVMRQFLTRTHRFFGGPDHLTLSNKLIRRQVAERAVRAALIIVEPPGFNDVLGLGERAELVHVQTLVSQASVKRFNEGVFHRFAGPNKVELQAPTIRPIFERRDWNSVP